MTEPRLLEGTRAPEPADVTAWLRVRGWVLAGTLDDIAQRWRRDDARVVVPLLTSAPDFRLRWTEMLKALSDAFNTDQAGILLAVAKAGSDIAEFRVSGQIDDSLPLGDASTLVESVRRAMQASANSALQPRSYYGHSIPEAAREHARNVRMGQTRSGSYIVPVICRLPILEPDEPDDALLFEEVSVRPFARTAMLRLAEGLNALHRLTHGEDSPTRREITDSVGAGVSSELCDAVASTLEAGSVSELQVSFSWAERLPASAAPAAMSLEGESAELIREVSGILKGEPILGPQTFVGYVKRLDRGEDDEIGRITLRVLDSDKARNITMELSDADYHVAGEANTDRRMVSVTGMLRREPGRALRFTAVNSFNLLHEAPGLFSDPG